MRNFLDSPFEGELDVVATLAEDAIDASLAELRRQDALTKALRAAMRQGARIDDLSAASGLSPAAIERRLVGPLNLEEDLDEISGVR
jgi:hypothetical protein